MYLNRTVSSQGAAVRTSGVVGWTLTDGSNPLTRFTVAWDVGNGGKSSKFSASLGSFVPTGEEMWLPVPKMISKGLSAIQSSNQLDDTIYLIQPKVILVAMNMTMKEGEELHYRLFVSVVPPNIDVWGWVKYFRETVDNKSALDKPKILNDDAKISSENDKKKAKKGAATGYKGKAK